MYQDLSQIKTEVTVFQTTSQREYTFEVSLFCTVHDLRKQIESKTNFKKFTFLQEGEELSYEHQSIDYIRKDGLIMIRAFWDFDAELFSEKMEQDHKPSFNRLKQFLEKMKMLVTCPISQQIIDDPVILSEGHTYEKNDIQKWIQQHHTSPITRQIIAKTLTPNRIVQNIIQLMKQYTYQNLIEKEQKQLNYMRLLKENYRKAQYNWLLKKQKTFYEAKIKALEEKNLKLSAVSTKSQSTIESLDLKSSIQQELVQKNDVEEMKMSKSQGSKENLASKNLSTSFFYEEKSKESDSLTTFVDQEQNLKSKCIQLLDFFNYLMDSFKEKSTIADRLKLEFQLTKPYRLWTQLNHDYVKFEPKKFISPDCKTIVKLSLNQCFMDDQIWKEFVEHGDLFENLESLSLNGNFIKNVTERDLLAFKSLKYLDLRNNFLNEESRVSLRKAVEKYSEIQINFDHQMSPQEEYSEYLSMHEYANNQDQGQDYEQKCDEEQTTQIYE